MLPCKFFPKGKCKKQDTCQFQHILSAQPMMESLSSETIITEINNDRLDLIGNISVAETLNEESPLSTIQEFIQRETYLNPTPMTFTSSRGIKTL